MIRLPNLFESLKDHDLGYLCILAQLWGLDLSALDAHSGAQLLASLMLKEELLPITGTTFSVEESF